MRLSNGLSTDTLGKLGNMRSAGLYLQDGEARPDIEDSVIGNVSEAARAQVRRFAAGRGNSQVVCLASEAAKPSLSWATRPDGSFAVVDGEIFNASDLYQTDKETAPGHAEAILAIYLSSGEAGLAKIDAAAFYAIWDALYCARVLRQSTAVFMRPTLRAVAARL